MLNLGDMYFRIMIHSKGEGRGPVWIRVLAVEAVAGNQAIRCTIVLPEDPSTRTCCINRLRNRLVEPEVCSQIANALREKAAQVDVHLVPSPFVSFKEGYLYIAN